MHFADVHILNWLWALLPVIGILFWFSRRKEEILRQFADAELLKELTGGLPLKREFWRNVLWIAALAFSIIALARPQWGYEWREVKRQGLDIVVAVDVSKSMLAQDVKPNRLERTKLAVQDLVKKLKGDRIGLVAFAGDAFLVCPLTADYHGFLLSLEDLDTDSVSRGGTNVAAAIEEAVKEYDQTPSRHKAVIVVTDGENLEGDPLSAANKVKAKGIKVFCVGIGTPEGELIQLKDIVGNPEFVKDEHGNFVKSRLNEDLLQKIALATGGIYVRAGGAEFGLDLIYERELSKLERRDIDTKMEKKHYERFQIPLALALLALLAEIFLALSRRPFREANL